MDIHTLCYVAWDMKMPIVLREIHKGVAWGHQGAKAIVDITSNKVIIGPPY